MQQAHEVDQDPGSLQYFDSGLMSGQRRASPQRALGRRRCRSGGVQRRRKIETKHLGTQTLTRGDKGFGIIPARLRSRQDRHDLTLLHLAKFQLTGKEIQ